MEKLTGVPYPEYQRRHIFDPLGMSHSSFVLNDDVRRRLANGQIRIADGRGGFFAADAPLFELATVPAGNLYTTAEDLARFAMMLCGEGRASFVLNDNVRKRLANGQMQIADGRGGSFAADAPLFELVTVPAGNLYTTAEDLARFAMMLCGEGRGGEQRILRPETLQQMFQSQAPQDRLSYGLGFVIGKFREHETVGHMGGVYGFTSSLLVIPKQKLAAVVLANDDMIAGTVTKLTEAALDLLLNLKLGEPLREEDEVASLSAEELETYAGDYESESYWARLEVRGERLWANVSGQEYEVTPAGGDRFWGDGGNNAHVAWNFERDAAGKVHRFTAMFQHFVRVDPAAVTEIPAAWNDFLGCYGPEFIPLVVSVKHGHLYAMTENMLDYRLTPLNRTSFHLPIGMYLGEELIFERGADGRVYAAMLGNMVLKRIDKY